MQTEWVQAAENVWVFPADPHPRKVEPNIGLVVTSAGSILIDGGNSPNHARRIDAAREQLGAPPVRYVVYTHCHWDHVFGTQVFDAPVIGHTLTHRAMKAWAARPWSEAYILQESAREPGLTLMYSTMRQAMRDQWNDFRLVVPSMWFEKTMTLLLGGIRVDLAHIGGQHADDSITARVNGVLFMGDCFYKAVQPKTEDEKRHDLSMVMRLSNDPRNQVFVDGHWPGVRTREEWLSRYESTSSQPGSAHS